jgi:hypothetical protein
VNPSENTARRKAAVSCAPQLLSCGPVTEVAPRYSAVQAIWSGRTQSRRRAAPWITSDRATIESMGTSPWWFTSLMTFVGVVFGGAVSIVTAWLTQRFALQTQVAINRAEAEATAKAALTAEKVKRYLAIAQNIGALYAKTANPDGRAEFLKAVREAWLLGDQELVCKLRVFLLDVAGDKDADSREQLFGDVILDMRKGLGLPIDKLSNQDFRFHSA